MNIDRHDETGSGRHEALEQQLRDAFRTQADTVTPETLVRRHRDPTDSPSGTTGRGMPRWAIPAAAAAAVLIPVGIVAAKDLSARPNRTSPATTQSAESTDRTATPSSNQPTATGTPTGSRTGSPTGTPTSVSTDVQTNVLPVARIGTGWTIATLGDSRSASTPLVVIDPSGRSYPLGPKVYRVYDITPDHTQILIEPKEPTSTGTSLAVLDLASAKVVASLPIAGGVTTAAFSRAHPDTVIVWRADGSRGPEAVRVNLSGTVLNAFPTTISGAPVQSDDGRLIAVPGPAGLTIYDPQGAAVRTFPAPAGTEVCFPRHFSASTGQLVASCNPLNPLSIPSNVYEFPVAGGAPTQLTFAKPGLTPSGYDSGYVDAWHGPTGLLVSKDDGAGHQLWYQEGTRAPARLSVPGVPDTVEVLLGDDRDNIYVARSCPLGDGGGGCTLFSGPLNAEWFTLAGYGKDKTVTVTSAIAVRS